MGNRNVQKARTLRTAVVQNLRSLGRAPEGWDLEALKVLRAGSRTVATAGPSPLFATFSRVALHCAAARGAP